MTKFYILASVLSSFTAGCAFVATFFVTDHTWPNLIGIVAVSIFLRAMSDIFKELGL